MHIIYLPVFPKRRFVSNFLILFLSLLMSKWAVDSNCCPRQLSKASSVSSNIQQVKESSRLACQTFQFGFYFEMILIYMIKKTLCLDVCKSSVEFETQWNKLFSNCPKVALHYIICGQFRWSFNSKLSENCSPAWTCLAGRRFRVVRLFKARKKFANQSLP